MKKLICLLILIGLGPRTFAQEVSPYVSISRPHGTNSTAQCSGVAVKIKGKVKVLTCAHICNGSKLTIKVEGHGDFSTTIDQVNNDLDFAILSAPNCSAQFKKLSIANDRLVPGVKGIVYGYVGPNSKLTTSPMVAHSYTYYATVNGGEILSCDGVAINGLSGGPLMVGTTIYGIQSGGSDHALFCPIDLIGLMAN